MKSVDTLEFSLFNTRWTPPSVQGKCDSAYSLWLSEWENTFKELEVKKQIKGDDFLDRELGGLFCGDQAVGFLLYNSFDLERECHLDHSYFDNYTAEVFDFLRSRKIRKIMVISYMTINSEWRKQFTDYPISEMLISFCTKRFMLSHYDALVGYFRTDRKTNQMFYRHGASPIIEEMVRYNVPVDFAYITKESARATSLNGVSAIADFLWDDFVEKRRENERDFEFIHGASGEKNSKSRMVG